MNRRPLNSDYSRETSGSPPSGEPVFLAVGYLRRAHGLQGEMVMDLLTDFPERLVRGKVVYAGEEHIRLTIRSLRSKGRQVLIAFEEVDDPESAAPLRNQYLFVRSDEIPPLPEGEYYHHELLGLNAFTPGGERLGTLVEILETGANDVYIIREESTQTELLVPAVNEFVLEIRLAERKIILSPPEWL
ncbi:ribosome maturation factor RimM [Bellilinea sp.]|jgi:16S rRNA processing protein RimM|uniref:ribosome maturation factor RimM n=1 Tax=Bellilinea sp. TaxID=2838785 RepID=UPI002ADE2058|nr:ribosome maturation factor RimM [Bellilinea sp.]